jgi:hypothetical protein
MLRVLRVRKVPMKYFLIPIIAILATSSLIAATNPPTITGLVLQPVRTKDSTNLAEVTYKLTWDQVPSGQLPVVGYHVFQRDIGETEHFSLMGSTTETQFLLPAGLNWDNLEFGVGAYTPINTGELKVTRVVIPPQVAPELVVAPVDGGILVVSIIWPEPESPPSIPINGYRVYERIPARGMTWTMVEETADRTYRVPQFPLGVTVVEWTVVAVSNGVEGPPSELIQVNAPEAPGNVAVVVSTHP